MKILYLGKISFKPNLVSHTWVQPKLMRNSERCKKRPGGYLASVNQQTIPDQTIVSTTSQVNKDSSPVHYQTMVWWDFFFSLRLKTLTCIISTLFLSFIRPWLPHQTINTFKNKSTCLFSSIRPWQPHQTINTVYQESTHFFSSIRPWSDGLFLQF